MKSRALLWGILLAAFTGAGLLRAGEGASSPEQCSLAMESVRAFLMQKLHRMERAFMDLDWHQRKFREAVYVPLWQAVQMSKDPYSPTRQAEGKMRVERYRHAADSHLEDAKLAEENLMNEFNQFDDQVLPLTESCDGFEFQDCMLRWQEKARERIGALYQAIEEFNRNQEEFAEEIQNTVHESPSEHHDFGGRYHERRVRFEVELYPNFLKSLREMREEIQYDWAADSCCHYCSAEAVDEAKHPFNVLMKADPEAYRGLEAGVVNRMAINEALDEFRNEEADSEDHSGDEDSGESEETPDEEPVEDAVDESGSDDQVSGDQEAEAQ